MTIWGISALSHDASISVVQDREILFAGHSERYSKVKNDKFLNFDILKEALKHGRPDKIVWFERPIVKKIRQGFAGEWSEVFNPLPEQYLKNIGLSGLPIEYVDHHKSHAAGGFYTSGFDDASIIVCDAIGEWATTSIWHGHANKLTKAYEQKYPNSVGLFYSAITDRVGLKANEEEYILMGMAAYGQPKFYEQIKKDLVDLSEIPNFRAKRNLHIGCRDWLIDSISSEQDTYDLAASAQLIVEEYMLGLSEWVSQNMPSKNLVLSGGVALNCVVNEKIAAAKYFENIWIMPNPGDAGSSLGAIAANEQLTLNWQHPYLGTNIDRDYDLAGILKGLKDDKIIAIANGRAEFGPRALGNRSLVADPRGDSIKDAVNDIKKRQRFRPFAPMVLEEYAHEFFDLPVKSSPYMQFTAKCKFPDLFPAICHHDGSSRVQTVNKEQNENLYRLLTEFYHRTGCPILLNTSLNIKGQPLVDTWEDALAFQRTHHVKVF